ncbi:MAG: GNAT family N-acetyltransferase [Candidatus Hodarchaeota archaeon]
MNFIELTFNQFKTVRPLFIQSNHLLFTVDAVIAGSSPGRVWVDQDINPRSVFMWDKAHCYYFAGDTRNTQFNSAIKNLLTKSIIPNTVANQRDIYKIEYSSIEWEPILEELLKKTRPIKRTRVFYAYTKQEIPESKNLLSNDFIIQKIDEELLNSTIKDVNTIIDEINQCWNSIDDFLNTGFGFCLIHKHVNEETSIQGWCTGEYFSNRKCGIGIETFYPHQRQGFATAMASAFVEYSLSLKIQPHWDSFTDNQASIRVAEKVGFKKIQEYTVLFGSFITDDR